ncbi:MAG: hypothetical protein HC828_15540 [Blastochloris sp.]|nr:hypothetical protein [Blastochloris sp.]
MLVSAPKLVEFDGGGVGDGGPAGLAVTGGGDEVVVLVEGGEPFELGHGAEPGDGLGLVARRRRLVKAVESRRPS